MKRLLSTLVICLFAVAVHAQTGLYLNGASDNAALGGYGQYDDVEVYAAFGYHNNSIAEALYLTVGSTYNVVDFWGFSAIVSPEIKGYSGIASGTPVGVDMGYAVEPKVGLRYQNLKLQTGMRWAKFSNWHRSFVPIELSIAIPVR